MQDKAAFAEKRMRILRGEFMFLAVLGARLAAFEREEIDSEEAEMQAIRDVRWDVLQTNGTCDSALERAEH